MELITEILDRVKDEVADYPFKWSELDEARKNNLWPEVCRRYAEEVNDKEMDELADICAKQNHTLKDKDNEISQLKKQLQEKEEFIQDGLDRMDQFDRAERQWFDENTKLKKQVEVAEQINTNYANEFHNLTGKIINLEKQVEEMETLLQEKEDEITAFNAKNNTQEIELKSLKSKIEVKEKPDFDVMIESLKDLFNIIHDRDTAIAERDTIITKLKKQIKELKTVLRTKIRR